MCPRNRPASSPTVYDELASRGGAKRNLSREETCLLRLRSDAVVTRGATTAEKFRGTKVWVPTPGRLPGWWWVLEMVAPSRCGGPGCHPEIFENSDAKSCILVTSALISLLPRTCISEQTTSMSRAKSVPNFQLFGRGCVPGC